MSSIRSAVVTVKNFFTNLVSPQHQEESRSNEEGNQEQQGHSSRFARSIFGRGGAKKRPAPSNVYEPEITDDEDDSPSFPYFPSCQNSKRLRVDSELDLEMASRRDCQQTSQQRYATRGSGMSPNIEGLQRQPWEFNFFSKRKAKHADDGAQVVGSNSKGTKGGLKASDRINTGGLPGSDTAYDCPGTSRTSMSTELGAMKDMYISKPTSSNKNVEVITLDDDNEPASTSKRLVQKQSTTPSGGNQLALMKPRMSIPMKVTRTRDSNRFSKYFDTIGRKITGIGAAYPPVLSVCLQEKSRYKQLLIAHNVLNRMGMYETSALTKSKVNSQQLEVMYKKFGTSPTKGAVTLRVNGKRLSSSKDCQELISPDDHKALVPVPRLFSTPSDEPVSRGSKAIAYKSAPEIIDLEEAASSSTKKIEACVSPITPVATRRSYTASTPLNNSSVGNFSCLEDALNSTRLPDEEDLPESSALALEDSPKEDEDISILAEKIVNKSRNKTVNTLALEQTLCPYVDKRWLEESKSSWRNNQKHRKQRIQEEAETLNILTRESTLEKDLEERIRKKLTLTEIIVLEEPPEELPELTDDILAIISHAKARGNDGEVLAQVRLPKDTISITRGDVRTLGPSQWLNDNVINTYMGLIVLRSKQNKFPSVYAFQTFFYPKLMKEGYSNSLKRWTRRDDIFAHDLIILPIHLGLHWCLACVDLRKKAIRYYDSLGGDNNKCLQLLLEYITREMKERKQIDLDKMEWTLENVKGIPQQQNGSDCGMFSCKFAEYLSRDANFTFKQEDMPYYRDRMIYELIKSDLLHP